MFFFSAPRLSPDWFPTFIHSFLTFGFFYYDLFIFCLILLPNSFIRFAILLLLLPLLLFIIITPWWKAGDFILEIIYHSLPFLFLSLNTKNFYY